MQIANEVWQALPDPLDHIRAAIEASRSLLELHDDWDEDGSPGVSKTAWHRAVEFLARHAARIAEVEGAAIEAPDIAPGPEGSIDLHWDSPEYRLLINIPADEGAMAGFYGDDRGKLTIKGTFDPSRMNRALIQWLMKN